MATILELEEAIIARLQAEIPEADVWELPTTVSPEEMGKAVARTQIWVAFREEILDPVVSVMNSPHRPPAQGRKIVYEIIVRGQALRTKGHQRIYPILDKIRDALSGWMPEAIHRSRDVTKPFYQERGGFTNMGAGLWVYSMTFATNSSYSAPIQ